MSRHAVRACAIVALFLIATSLSGCADRVLTATRIAQQGGLTQRIVEAGPFRLLTYERLDERAGDGAPLIAYIEGDGRAWITRIRQSSDPTPIDPVALRLAEQDPAPNVLYIARPCQFPSVTGQQDCEARYWGAARYSATVVEAIATVIADVARRTNSRAIELIGYSGGGVLATLIAARHPAMRVITVGANLDLAFWSELQAVSPLTQSLDPADEVEQLNAVPQIVMAGGRDDIVPAAVAQHYLARFPTDHRPQLILEPLFSHECCWVERWPELLGRARGLAAREEERWMSRRVPQ
jgi:dienelactone hydrolase